MLHYRCPACGKQHAKAAPFEGPFQAKCLRCRAAFAVTGDLVQQAAAPAETPSDAITPAVRPKPPVAVPEEAVMPGLEARASLAALADGEAEDREREPAPETPPPSAKPPRKKKEPAPYHQEPESDPRKWYIRGGIAAGVLLLVGGIGVAVLLRGSGKAERPAAKKKATPKKGTTTVKAKAPDPPAPRVIQALEPRNQEPIRISAARLSAELAADPEAARRNYDRALLEVTGLFSHFETSSGIHAPGVGPQVPKTTPGKNPPIVPRLHFRTAGRPLACEVASSRDLTPWLALKPGEPVTLRAVHVKDGQLRSAQLREPGSSADGRFGGREVEVVGSLDAFVPADDRGVAHPTLRLEGDTFGTVSVDCLFPRSDEAELRKLTPGSRLTIRGSCNGRQRRGKEWYVRLDNCRFAQGTGSTAAVPHLAAGALARAYEEDLRVALVPPWGQEPRVEGTFTVERLNEEVRAGREAFEGKYRYRVVSVTGRVLRKWPATPSGLETKNRDGVAGHEAREVVLESGKTDHPLKVRCRFDRFAFTFVEDQRELTVRGLCNGLADGGTLALENAEVVLPPGMRGPRLSADFLPHTPGRVLVYDVAAFAVAGKRTPRVVRQRWFQRDKGLTETMITHSGYLPGRSLLDAADPGAWFKGPRTKAGRLPGTVYHHRVTAAGVEVGQPQAAGPGKNPEVAWELMVKVGARKGDGWKWSDAHGEHRCTVEGFGERRGQVSVTVREVVTSRLDVGQVREVLHVYVRGLGEVERRGFLRLTSTERQTLVEARLVRVEEPVPAR